MSSNAFSCKIKSCLQCFSFGLLDLLDHVKDGILLLIGDLFIIDQSILIWHNLPFLSSQTKEFKMDFKAMIQAEIDRKKRKLEKNTDLLVNQLIDIYMPVVNKNTSWQLFTGIEHNSQEL